MKINIFQQFQRKVNTEKKNELLVLVQEMIKF